MKKIHRSHFRWRLAVLGMLAAAFTLGCSQGIRNAPVDAGLGREALREALESWKKGEAVDALQSGTPPIYVIDTDWQAGVKLKDYQIVGDGEEKDAQLFCPVKLVLQGSGGPTTKQVTFIISTAPNFTVSRKVF